MQQVHGYNLRMSTVPHFNSHGLSLPYLVWNIDGSNYCSNKNRKVIYRPKCEVRTKICSSDQGRCASQSKKNNQDEQNKGLQVVGCDILIGMTVKLDDEQHQKEQQWYCLHRGTWMGPVKHYIAWKWWWLALFPTTLITTITKRYLQAKSTTGHHRYFSLNPLATAKENDSSFAIVVTWSCTWQWMIQ